MKPGLANSKKLFFYLSVLSSTLAFSIAHVLGLNAEAFVPAADLLLQSEQWLSVGVSTPGTMVLGF